MLDEAQRSKSMPSIYLQRMPMQATIGSYAAGPCDCTNIHNGGGQLTASTQEHKQHEHKPADAAAGNQDV